MNKSFIKSIFKVKVFALIGFIGGLILLWLSLKTVTEQLLFLLGSSLFVILALSFSFYFYRKKNKSQINKNQAKMLNFEDLDIDNTENSQRNEEKELILPKIYKK